VFVVGIIALIVVLLPAIRRATRTIISVILAAIIETIAIAVTTVAIVALFSFFVITTTLPNINLERKRNKQGETAAETQNTVVTTSTA
jgi:urea transporter